jgi:hypothetical protein
MANSTYPSLSEFQAAHRKLLREYISAIDFASGLPFFVSLTRLLTPHENETAFMKLNRQSWFLGAPITWKPFIRFLVESHIKAKMGELNVAYNKLLLRLPEGKKFEQFRGAFKSAVAECNQLSDTLTTWKNGKTLLAGATPIVLGWLASWLGTDNLLLALPKVGVELQANLLSGPFASYLQIVVWAATSLGLLFLLLNQAFEGKRAIFLPTWVRDRSKVNTYNIYASEDELFRLLGHHKTSEFPLDSAAFIVLSLFVIASFVLRFYYYFSSILLVNLLAVPVLIFLVVLIFRSSNQRWN